MTERVLEAQGEFKISSTKTGGTAISIKLPIII
jgi:signal transduction histidine kinase